MCPSFPPFLLKSALKQMKQNNCFQKTLSVLCKTHLTHRQSMICYLEFSLPVLWGVYWRNLFLSFSLLMVPFNFTCNWIFPLVILNFLAKDGPITSWQIDGKTLETMTDYFLGLRNHCRWLLPPQNKKMLVPWKKSYDKPRQHIKKQRHYCADKGP